MRGVYSTGGSSEEGGARKGCYKLDNNLEISKSTLWENQDKESSGKVMTRFPSLVEFINLACIAYENQTATESRQNSKGTFNMTDFIAIEMDLKEIDSKEITGGNFKSKFLNGLSGAITGFWDQFNVEQEDVRMVIPEKIANVGRVPQNFDFLAEASNSSISNGYYGVAYINTDKKQIILSHRGTDSLGALWTDAKSIWWGSYTSRVSSAMTFAHNIAQFAQENGCQIFFTGHSLGAWLAQVTCFSTKYLTLDAEGHFIRKPSGDWDDLHPYTVVFDSPGAFQFLQIMKNELFLLNEPTAQAVNVSCLPVEVFQFYPNTVNKQNTQIGSVYLVDLDKANVTYSYAIFNVPKPLTKQTHSMEPIVDLMSRNSNSPEENLLRSQELDWRIENWEDFLHKSELEGRSIPVEVSKFPTYFLTNEEFNFLMKEKDKPENGGSYEGLYLEEEAAANSLVYYVRTKQPLENGTLQLGVNLDRRQAIPLIRHTLEILKKGRIWWNGRKPTLPPNYIHRNISRSSQFNRNGSLPSTAERKALLEMEEDLILLVDPPGMGKSTEMTNLELKLRNKIPQNRIILRVNLNEVQKALSTISNENPAEVLNKLAPFVPLKTLQMGDVHLFVLLDGLDEVCPTYEESMITLLRILRPSQPATDYLQRHLVVTMRPHLRNPMESAFNVESFSLVPLEPKEQNKYIQAELGVTAEELTELRNKFKDPLTDLLSNPLMLFMLVDILKSPESHSVTSVINIYDLYSRFVSSKHKLHLVTKKRMAADDNFTELEVESMLERNLRFYFVVAWKELLWGDKLDSRKIEIPTTFVDWIGNVIEEPPSSGSVHTELLSYGLLTLNTAGRLVFKHRSFAEFFYSNLLCHPDTRQEVRDTLFGYIYGPLCRLRNVEIFVAAAITNTNLQSNFNLTSKWLLISPIEWYPSLNFSKFAGEKLFHILIRQVLIAFFRGDPQDLFIAFRVLVYEMNREAFAKVFNWMRENREWSRENLFNKTEDESPGYSTPVARLIVAIKVLFGGGDLLTKIEVEEGFKSCKNLLLTIACIEYENKNKWNVLEKPFGKTKFKDLVEEADSEEFYFLITSDAETVRKLFTTFTREELYSLVLKEETRVSDALGDSPMIVLAAFGEDFIPQKSHLAEFRGKFGRNEGKSVFEMDGCDFALKYLWEDLLREAKERNPERPVTVALREALARNGGSSTSSKLLHKLEKQIRRRRGCPRDSDKVIRVMEWLVDGFFFWNELTSFEYEMLPFLICYSASAEHAAKLFEQNKSIKLEDEPTLLTLLQFLVLSTHLDNSTTFSKTKTFLQNNLRRIPPKWASVTQKLSSAEKAELRECLPLHPSLLVSDISVGQVFIALLPESLTEEEFAWEEIVSDVIRSTRCCNIHATLSKLRTLLSEKKLWSVLLSYQVRNEWLGRTSSRQRKEADYSCGLRSLLSFYFDVFGLNLDWMNEYGPPGAADLPYLVLPVEMLTILEAKWNQLVPQFEEMVKKLLGSYSAHLVSSCSYKTEWEWERLLRMIPTKENALKIVSLMSEMSDISAVPFVRVLMRTFKMDKSNKEFFWTLLQTNHFRVFSDSLQIKASLLHIFIELEYVEQVERYALPGLLLWRNSERKNALELAQEKLGNDHQITRHLQKHYNLLTET